MVMPSLFEITFPISRVSVPEARAILSPFLERAYHEGVSPYEFYHQVVAKTSLTMTTGDYYSWANAKYSHWDKATSQLSGDPLSPFLISELAQEKSSLPDRFWAKVSYTNVLPSGEEQTQYITYGFNDKMSVADLENDAYDYLSEAEYAGEGTITSVTVTELYKQY